MSYNPQNPNGQVTSANSAPVVIASDQSAVTTTTIQNIINPSPSGSNLGPNLTATGQYVSAQVQPGSLYSICVSNPSYEPQSNYSVTFESSSDNSTWNAINVLPKTISLSNSPTNTISHTNVALANVPIGSNYALTSITNHGLTVGQQIFFGQATATQGAYIPGVYGPTITACNTSTGVFTCNNNFVSGQVIYFESLTATGISINTYYYIATATSTTFTISASLNSAIIVPSAFTYAIIAPLFTGVPYYVTSVPTSTTFTVGVNPTTTYPLIGCPIIAAGAATNIATISALAGNNITTSFAHGLVVNQPVLFPAVGSITGITANTLYYVQSVPSTTTFTVSATQGGSVITLGGAFTGATLGVSGSLWLGAVTAAGVFTTTNAVNAAAAHGFSLNQPIQFSNAGSLTGITANTTYYVNTIPTSSTFTVSAMPGGMTIATGAVLGGAVVSTSSTVPTSLGVGLFTYQVPISTNYIRARLSAFGGNQSSVQCFIDAFGTTNARCNLPFVGGSSVPSGTPVVPLIETSNIGDIVLDATTITNTILYGYQTDDPTSQFYNSQSLFGQVATTGAYGVSINAASPIIRYVPSHRYAKIVALYAAANILLINGASFRTSPIVEVQEVAINNTPNIGTVTTVSTVTAVTSLSQIAASIPSMNISNGSTNKGLGVTVGAATTNVDYSAQAWAAVSGVGAIVADAIGDGQSVSFAVSLTAWTAGASTGLYIYLQESPDNGTTWTDIWACEPFTAIGIARIPAIPIGGRRRMRWVNRAGAATTATVTVTVIKSPSAFVTQRQFFDWGTTGTAANSNLITGAPATTSTSTIASALGTTGQNTAAYPIDGCKVLTVKCLVSGGTAVTAPVFTIQVSDDFTNWVNTGTTLTAPLVAGMSMVTLNGIAAKYVRAQLTTAQAGGTAVALTYLSFVAVN